MNKELSKKEKSTVRSKHSMGWRILFWMSLVAMGPLLIMAYQGYHCARQAVVESQEGHLKSVLQSRKIMLEAWLAKIKTDLYFLSLTPCSGKMCNLPTDSAIPTHAKDCCKLLDSVQKGSTYYKTIASYNSGWKPHHQGSGPDIQNLLSTDFKSKMAEAKGLVIAPAIVSENIVAGHPVIKRENSEVAYIIASLDLTRAITPILSNRTGLGNSGKVYLLSSEGHYLSSPSGFSNLLGQKNHLPPQIISQNSPTVFEYEDFRGVHVLGVADKIQELDWTIVTEMDYEEAFAWLGTLRSRAFVTGVITLVVVLFVSMKSAKKLSQPLKKLAAVSRRIALGHPDALHWQQLGNSVPVLSMR
jgi:methyl-accepting chemotaxis protein